MARIWFITGAASGLCREIARTALAEGDEVIIADRNPAGADDLIAAFPDRASSVRMDLTDAEQVREVAAEAIERTGGIDILVNGAGRGYICSVENMPDVDMRSLMELLFFGPFTLMQTMLPHMRKRGSGAIINISSEAGQTSVPGMSAYCAGKSGLEAISGALAEEMRPFGIKVLVPQPGAMRTNLISTAMDRSPHDPAYDGSVGAISNHVARLAGEEPGDPVRIARAIIAAIDADNTPLRLSLTSGSYDALVAAAEKTRLERCEWETVSRSVEFDFA